MLLCVCTLHTMFLVLLSVTTSNYKFWVVWLAAGWCVASAAASWYRVGVLRDILSAHSITSETKITDHSRVVTSHKTMRPSNRLVAIVLLAVAWSQQGSFVAASDQIKFDYTLNIAAYNASQYAVMVVRDGARPKPDANDTHTPRARHAWWTSMLGAAPSHKSAHARPSLLQTPPRCGATHTRHRTHDIAARQPF